MSGVSNNTGKISLFNRTSIAVKATHFRLYIYTRLTVIAELVDS